MPAQKNSSKSEKSPKTKTKTVANRVSSKKVTTKTSKKNEAPIETTAPRTPAALSRISATKINRKYVILGGILIILGLLAYQFRDLFVAAIVNGTPITRLQVVQTLEEQGGQTTLDRLVNQTLILQEAQKQGITVTEEEIQEEVNQIDENLSAYGQNLDEFLAFQGTTREALVEEIRFQKYIEKIIEPKITVADEEVDAFIEQSQQSIIDAEDPEELRNQARETLKQQKIEEEFQTWLAELRQNSNIQYIKQY